MQLFSCRGGWTRQSPEVPANLNNSVVLFQECATTFAVHKVVCFVVSLVFWLCVSFGTFPVCDLPHLKFLLAFSFALLGPDSDVDVSSWWSRKLLPFYGSSCTSLSSGWFLQCEIRSRLQHIRTHCGWPEPGFIPGSKHLKEECLGRAILSSLLVGCSLLCLSHAKAIQITLIVWAYAKMLNKTNLFVQRAWVEASS